MVARARLKGDAGGGRPFGDGLFGEMKRLAEERGLRSALRGGFFETEKGRALGGGRAAGQLKGQAGYWFSVLGGEHIVGDVSDGGCGKYGADECSMITKSKKPDGGAPRTAARAGLLVGDGKCGTTRPVAHIAF
ncbi:MAG: hypothetical protein AAF601_04510 [Pseudomonadota bacterium]